MHYHTEMLSPFLSKKKNVKPLEPVWYMCLKIENYCLKIFIKIRVGKKVRENT